MTTTDVDNWPADDSGVQGPDLMERFRKHAERFDTEIVHDHIHKAHFDRRPFHPALVRSLVLASAVLGLGPASARAQSIVIIDVVSNDFVDPVNFMHYDATINLGDTVRWRAS